MVSQAAVAAALLAVGAAAVPANNSMVATPVPTPIPTPVSGDACATYSALLDSSDSYPPASIGYKCLKAVPIDAEGDAQLLQELRDFFEWQSTLAYLKNPPAGYGNAPVDILGGLDQIATKLAQGGYTSEYDFQKEISRLIAKSYDGHTSYVSDIESSVAFYRGDLSPLVSLSLDGKSLPKVYLVSDVYRAQKQSNFTLSAIKTINNQSATDYLYALADLQNGYHDPDARYNSLFWNPAQNAMDNKSGVGNFIGGFDYEHYGSDAVLGHEDGTTTTLESVAKATFNFTGVGSAKAFLEALKLPDQALVDLFNPTETATPTSSSTPAPTQFSYPYPVNKTSDNTFAGYFLNGTNYDDVAVLANPSFDSADVVEVQDFLRKFLADAVAAKKTHLIVDLRGNGGGKVVLGSELFKQLFPQTEPYGGTRIRANSMVNGIGNITSTWADGVAATGNGDLTYLQDNVLTEFWYDDVLDVNGSVYQSWQDLYGPARFNGDNFTNLLRTNYSDAFSVPGPLNVTGYTVNARPAPQPFKAENIVLLQDGACGSTCAVFTEFVKTQAGVRQLAIGGRPQAGPMQGVGGTKGAETIDFGAVWLKANGTVGLANTTDLATQALLNTTGVAGFYGYFFGAAFNRTTFNPASLQLSAVINYRDNTRQGDSDQTPLQFVHEDADCRLWYTPAMVFDPSAVWKAAADAMWRANGTASACIAGSTNGNGTTSSSSGSGAGGNGTSTAPGSTSSSRPSPTVQPTFPPSENAAAAGTSVAAGSVLSVAVGLAAAVVALL